MTRNRAVEGVADVRPGRLAHAVGALLTLLLLLPATALLTARGRALVQMDTAGAPAGCSGVDTLGPVLQAGLPVVALLLAVPAALLALNGRGRGWIALVLVLVATVALEVALRTWLPACL